MKALIVYDSLYGNTDKVAHAIGEVVADAKVVPVDEADLVELKGYDLLIVGSPTQGAGRQLQSVSSWGRSLAVVSRTSA